MDEIVQGLCGSNWRNKTAYQTNADIKGILEEYYRFIRNLSFLVQEEIPEIISREAIWIAAAVITYNEHIRTGSRDIATYQFPQNVISTIAQSYNSANSKITCGQMAWRSCTDGLGEQPWSYLVDMGGVRRNSRRRLSYFGEFEYTQPEFHADFMVKTITGQISVKQLSEYIKNVYSPTFFKQLTPPLDASHSVEEMEQHARQMDYESLRAAAIDRGTSRPRVRMVTSRNYDRDPYISLYARERAQGICQLCHGDAPFKNNRDEPYLEIHHVIWLSQGGPDSVDNVTALCPNCHRKMHIVNDEKDVAYLQKMILSGK